MAKQQRQQPKLEPVVGEEIKDRVQSEAVEPEKVETPAEPETKPSAPPPEPPKPVETEVVVEDKLEQYNPATHIIVNRKLFNKMITTLVLNKGLFLYTGNGLTTQLGEMMGLKKDEPGFYEKARTLMHEIMVEHQKG